ncbi:pseudouridine synthase [Rhodopseudomonas sp. NSM]|uniref:pseudouridine synthase n=1 Tax=Rhodopseudomonas sp. NSM TaxID=3457630 RepID=UPI0040354CA2
MPRDTDKNNASARGRRDRPGAGKGASGGRSAGGGKGASGGKGRSGAARGPEKKFAKRGEAYEPRGDKPFAKKAPGGDAKRAFGGEGKRPYVKRDGAAPRRDFADRPRRDDGDAPRPRFNRDERPARSGGDRPERGPRKEFGDKRSFAPREGGDKRPYTPRADRGDGARPAGRFGDKKFGDRKPYASREGGEKRPYTPREGGGEKRPYTPREGGGEKRPYAARAGGEKRSFTPRGDGEKRPYTPRAGGDKRPYAARDGGGEKRSYAPRADGEKRPYTPREGGDKRPFKPREGGDRKFGRGAPDRGPRKEFGSRPERGSDRGESKPWQKREGASAERGERGARSFDKPRFDKPREDRGGERPKFERRERSGDWHEHPRSEAGGSDRPRSRATSERGFERPRRANEDESKIFAKRPAFGGRGAYRERPKTERAKPRAPAAAKASDKTGDRIAKVVARAGLCSRRDAEAWVAEGRVAVNGVVIDSPALDVMPSDVITVDGKPLPERERTRLFLYHKPRGLMTTHADPEGRPTVFDNLPEDLPRLISIGRLDFNTEGLLLLTNDGGLARALELPETGWLRRYRVRAHGEVTQAQLDQLRDGIEVDGVKYGEIEARLERDQGANVWLVFAIREGKNREVRNVLAHLGLEVNRLIRVSYGPFQLQEIEEGQVEEVKTRVLREQLGDKIIKLAEADFGGPSPSETRPKPRPGKPVTAAEAAPAPKKKAPTKRGAVEDRKGRKVKVERTGSGDRDPSRGPARRYHGKREPSPRED